MRMTESAARPDQMDYYFILKKSPPPPPSTADLAGIDAGLLDQAGGLLDSVTGALDVIDSLGSIPDIGDPTPPLRNALDGVSTAMADLGSITTSLNELFGESN